MMVDEMTMERTSCGVNGVADTAWPSGVPSAQRP
jgi:hypothetical protein